MQPSVAPPFANLAAYVQNKVSHRVNTYNSNKQSDCGFHRYPPVARWGESYARASDMRNTQIIV